MLLSIHSKSETETLALGEALGRVLRPGDVVALHGELGAGKTCLARGITRGAGADDSQVSSPTFVIVHEYPARGEAGTVVFHADAYRLRSAEDLDSLGWDRVMDGRGIVLVEWPERVESAAQGAGLPARSAARRADITLAHVSPTERGIELEVPDAWADRPGLPALVALTAGERGRLPEGWARCPMTNRPVPPRCPTFPFADAKSRMADLNRWFTGAYRLSREVEPDDLDENLPEVGRGAK